MRILSYICCSIISPITLAISIYEGTAEMIMKWLVVMMLCVIADLCSGLWKCVRLGIDVSFSTAIRETLGKIVIYSTFVLMVSTFDFAMEGDEKIAKWCCAFICFIELGSVISNILKPHGIDVSLRGIIKSFLYRSPLRMEDDESDSILGEKRTISEIRRAEQKKWQRGRKI